MSDAIREARLQLFDASIPGDLRLAERIHLEGVVAVRDSWSKALREPRIVEAEIHAAGARFITPESASWPKGLRDLVAPPIGLTIRGEIPAGEIISIVGTRNPTHYGERVTRIIATGLVDHGFVIASGGALGIDTEAHRSALDCEGMTIAIIASGVAVDYPTSNKRLFSEIAARGAVISEVMPDVSARPERFLTRNRLIAAISTGTIVVEAAYRSGSLRTARDAAEMLRPVMAVPGPITSPASEGCHRLIADRTAEIVSSVADVIDLLSPLSP